MRPFAPGRTLAPGVSVLAHLARSRVLDVYDAWCEPRGCRVIAKTLRPDRASDGRARDALVREGDLLKRLAHPHLVRAYEVHRGERPLVVLETLSGETVAHLARRRQRLSTAELRHLGSHVASALGYLHGQDLLHLDVKPANVIADAGRAKLIDMSVAQAPGPVRAGRGTWCNMAPEQARGGEVGPGADVWGLGVLLYEAATGVNLFEEWGDDHDYPQLHVRPEPVRKLRRSLDGELAALISAALELDPADRPRTADFVERP